MSGLKSKICTVDGCSEIIRCKGLCKLHYQRHLEGVALDARRNIPRDGPCLVDGCDRPRRSRGLCAPHYSKSLRSATCSACGVLISNKSSLCSPCWSKALAAALPTQKKCLQCDRLLPMSEFSFRKSAGGKAKWRSRCKDCETANSLARSKIRSDRTRGKDANATYHSLRKMAESLGIDWHEVVRRYPTDNRCEICHRTPQEASPRGRYERLALDHCHETGELRGFLCSPCNSGIGHLGDSLASVRAALRYLQRVEKQMESDRRDASGQLSFDEVTA